jgi:hypothetical protein
MSKFHRPHRVRESIPPQNTGFPGRPNLRTLREGKEGTAAPVQALDGARDEFLAPLDARLI